MNQPVQISVCTDPNGYGSWWPTQDSPDRCIEPHCECTPWRFDAATDDLDGSPPEP